MPASSALPIPAAPSEQTPTLRLVRAHPETAA